MLELTRFLMSTKTEFSHSQGPDNLAAVIVTLHPELEFKNRMVGMLGQVPTIVIVDNGTSGPAMEMLREIAREERISLIENKRNLGLAAAHNLGLQSLIERGFTWALTLDQDSEPAEDMVKQLCASYDNSVEKRKIAIIAPRIIDQGVEREALFLRRKNMWIYERVGCEEDDLENISTAITSGALINLHSFNALGGFREDFFIDYVDTDFCLRANLHGYQIIASCQARLMHQFGARQKVRKGIITLYPSFHSPERWYTIYRNRIPMLKKYALKFPHWMFYEIVAMFYTFTRMLLTEDQKIAKLMAIIKGTWDGITGKLGPPAWASGPLESRN